MSGIVISASGIDPATLSAARIAVEAWAVRRDGRVVLWAREPPAGEGWLPPSFVWVEADDADRVARALTRAVDFDLFLSVSAGVAFDLESASRLTRAVLARRSLPRDVRDDLELAIQEAVSNAVVRGDLGVAGPRSRSIDDFESHTRLIAERLADPRYTRRRVEVGLRFDDDRLTIEVSDEGGGFDISRVPRRADPLLPSGRGLDLIARIARRFALEDGGRRLKMELTL